MTKTAGNIGGTRENTNIRSGAPTENKSVCIRRFVDPDNTRAIEREMYGLPSEKLRRIKCDRKKQGRVAMGTRC